MDIKTHLANIDLSFLPVVRNDIEQLKDRIEVERKTPKDWDSEIQEVEKRLEDIEQPKELIYLNSCAKVIGYSLFIDSHLAIVKANNGKPKFRPYLERLQYFTETIRGIAPTQGGREHFSEWLNYVGADIYSHVQNLEFEK